MAISFNDNIRAQVNRPTDFRFGPFDSIAQANSIIPIAQRYHGLIFGVYTDPLNITTSDIDFYYYWKALADTDILPLGGKPPVDGEYANQAAMIAAQATQTAQYIYYDNASYWEYLGTTNGNITDYREIGGGSPDIYESLTFAQLQTLISGNSLIPGKAYLVSDFQTIHRILGTSAINTGPIEPLVSVAISTNTLSSSAVSITYPKDSIIIDWTNVVCEDGVTPRKGWIVDRYDPINNIYIQGYDWRNVKYRRYKILSKRKDEITSLSPTSLDLFVSVGGSLGSSLNSTVLFNAFTGAITNSAGSITITIRNATYSYTRPLYKFDNSTTFTTNELANKSGQITYCPIRNAFIFMYMNNNGFGENIVTYTLAPYSSSVWAPGNGISYNVDSSVYLDFTTLGTLASSSNVNIGLTPNPTNSNMTNNVFYLGANDVRIGDNAYNNTFISKPNHFTAGNEFYDNYFIYQMNWCQLANETFSCYFNLANNNYTGTIQDVTFTNTVYSCSFYLGSYLSIELTAATYSSFYLEGNVYTFVGGIYENSRVYFAGSGGGSGRTNFISRMPFRNCTLGYFNVNDFTINQRLLNTYYYQRPLSNNIFDSIALRNIPSGTSVNLLGVTSDGDVVVGTGGIGSSKWTDTSGGIYYSNAIGVGTSTLVSGRSATFNSDIQVNGLRVGRGNNNNISNAVLGDSALEVNTSGFSNLALGQSALSKNTSGYINAAVGPQSLRETTTGIFNTATGGSAMQNNTTGSWNTGIGGQAIAASSTSSFNSAVGGLSISELLTSSNHNSALGYRAAKYLTSIADLPGNFLTSANQSVFIGSEVMAGVNSVTNSIVIGYRAIGLGSNTTVVGNSSTTFGRWWGNLLLGTSTNSTFLLDVNGTSRFSNDVTVADTKNIILETTTGTKIGTATSQKLSLWNATPDVQPTTAITASAFVANSSGILDDTATFGGYTIGQIVAALKRLGALA